MEINVYVAEKYGTKGQLVGIMRSIGLYCFTCNVRVPGDKNNMAVKCRTCGQEASLESLYKTYEIRYHRFDDDGFVKKEGVCPAHSFTWLVDPMKLEAKGFIDDYFREMSSERLRKMIHYECPVVEFAYEKKENDGKKI